MRNMAILVLASLTLVFTACGNQGVNDSLPSDLKTQALLATPGSLDSSFGTGGLAITEGQYSAGLVVQGDGKALVLNGSGFRNLAAMSANLTRLNQNGQPDPSFGSSGVIQFAGRVGAVALLCPNGANAYNDWGASCEDPERAVIAVNAVTNGIGALKVYRFLPSGQPDLSFGQNGVAIAPSSWYSQVVSIAIQADGKILVAGWLFDIGGHGFVARLKRNGTPDPTFGNGGLTLLPSLLNVTKMVLPQSEYPVVLAMNDDGQANVFRLTDQGLPDPQFGINGVVTLNFGLNGFASALLALDDGRLIVGGSGALWKLRTNGTPDSSFGVNGQAVFSNLWISDLTLDDQNRLIAGVSTLAGPGEGTIARFRSNGTLDPNFGIGGLAHVLIDVVIDGSANINRVAVQRNGRILGVSNPIYHRTSTVKIARLMP